VVYQWNFAVERQLTNDWWRARRMSVRSRAGLLESLELNPSVYTAGSKLSTDARRAFQPYGSISQASQDINSGYNSLQLTLQKRFTHGLTLLANYTWSKSIDDLPYNQGITGVAAGSNFADSVELRRPASIRYRSIGVRPYAAVCDVVRLQLPEVCRNQSHAPHGRRRLAVERDLHGSDGRPADCSGG